jgi:WD40 repeat protein
VFLTLRIRAYFSSTTRCRTKRRMWVALLLMAFFSPAPARPAEPDVLWTRESVSGSPLAFSPDNRFLLTGYGVYEIEARRFRFRPEAWGSPFMPSPAIFSPDSRTLIGASLASREVHLWRVEDGRRMISHSFNGFIGTFHEDRPRFAFSPDGRKVAIGALEYSGLTLYEVDTGAKLWTVHRAGGLAPAAFTPDGQQVVCLGPNRIEVRAVSDGSHIRTLDLTGETESRLTLAVSPTGETAAAVRRNDTGYILKIWRVGDGQTLHSFPLVESNLSSMSDRLRYSPNGAVLAVRTTNRDPDTNTFHDWLRLWRVDDGSPLPHKEINDDIAFTPDGGTLVHKTTAWRLSDGSLLYSHPEASVPAYHGIVWYTYSPDGSRLAVSKSYGIYAPRSIPLPDPFIDLYRDGVFQERLTTLRGIVGFTPDGEFLIARYAHRFRATDGASAGPMPPFPGPFPASLNDSAVAPDGTMMATAHGAPSQSCYRGIFCNPEHVGIGLYLWDLTGERRDRSVTSIGPVYSADFSPDGRLLATGSGTHTYTMTASNSAPRVTVTGDFSVRLLNPADGTILHTFPDQGAAVLFVRFSPDGRTLASLSAEGDLYRLYFWDTEEKRLLGSFRLPSRDYRALDFTEDGTAIRVRENTGVRWYDVAYGRHLKAIPGSFFSDGEKYLVSRSFADVRVHRASDGAVVQTYHGLARTPDPLDFRFSPDHKYFAYFTGGGIRVARFTESDSAPPPAVPGDVVRDDAFNVLDVVKTLQFALGLAQPDARGAWAADVNRDGGIDVADAVTLLRFIAGAIESL